jgi:hypothetical protein
MTAIMPAGGGRGRARSGAYRATDLQLAPDTHMKLGTPNHTIMTITKDGQPILDLADWRKRAGPKSSDQWREDRSAMEAARSWLAASPALPAEISFLLSRHSAFGIVNQWEAEPEARLPFDDFPGEPRNADLAVYARDQFGDFVLAVLEVQGVESTGNGSVPLHTASAFLTEALCSAPLGTAMRDAAAGECVIGKWQGPPGRLSTTHICGPASKAFGE